MNKKRRRRLAAIGKRKIQLGGKEQAKNQENTDKSLQKLPQNETKSSNKTERMSKEIVQDAASNVSTTGHVHSVKIMPNNSHVLTSNISGPLPKPEKLTPPQKKQKLCGVISKKHSDPEKPYGTLDDQTTRFFSEIDIYFEPRLNTKFSNTTISRAAAVSSETSSLSNQEIVCSTKLEPGQMQTDLVDSSTSPNLTDLTECTKSEKEMYSVECSGIQNGVYSHKCSCYKAEATKLSVNDNELDVLQALRNPLGLQFGDSLVTQSHTDSGNCPDDNAEDFPKQVSSERINSSTGMCLEPDEIESSSSNIDQKIKSISMHIESLESSLKLRTRELLEDNYTVASVAKSTSKTPISKLSASTREIFLEKLMENSFSINLQKKRLQKFYTDTERSKTGFSECRAFSSEFHHDFITSDLSHTDSGVQYGISANPQVSSAALDRSLFHQPIFDDLPAVPSQASDMQSWIPIQASGVPPPIPQQIPPPASSSLLSAPLQASNRPSLIQLQTSSSAASVPLKTWHIPLPFYSVSDILFSFPLDNPSSVPSQTLDISSLILSQSPETSAFVSSLDSCSLSSAPLQAATHPSQAFVVSSFQSSFINIFQPSLPKILMLGPFPPEESSGRPLLFPSQALNISLLYPQASDAPLSVSLQSSDSQQQTSFSSLSATSKSSDHSSLIPCRSSDTFPSQGSCSPSIILSLTSGSSSLFSQASGSSRVPSQSSCYSSLISSQPSGSSSSILSQALDIPPLYSQAPDNPLLVLLQASDTGLQASDTPLPDSLQATGTSLSVPLQTSAAPLSVTSHSSDTPSVLLQAFYIPPLYSQAPDSTLPVPLQASDTGLQASPLQASNTSLSVSFQASDTQFQASHTPLSVPLQASCNLSPVPSQISCSRTSVSSQTSDTALDLHQARDSSSSVSSQFSRTSSVPAQDSNSSSISSLQDSDSLSSDVPQASDTSVSFQDGASPLSVSMQFSGSTSISLQASVGFSFRIPIISRIVKWILKKFWKGRRKLLVVVLLILITKAAFRIHHYIQQNGDVEFSYMQRCLYKYLSFIEFISVMNKSRR